MKMRRRTFLHLAAGTAAISVAPRIARAQGYPARPVRAIVGFPPGGAADIAGRLGAQWLSQRLHQSFIVENHPGAATNIATEEVVRAAPDGYTLLVANTTNAINASYYQNLHFDFVRDVAPVAGIIRVPNVMIVTPSLPVNNVAEFIAYAKANPGKINMASGGSGTSIHVAGELFKMMAGVDLIHVPYRGDAPAMTDLIGGQVQVMFDLISAAIGFIKSGKVRALAVTTATRSPILPDVPTVAETVPGCEAISWQGFGAPKDTPRDVVVTLNAAMNEAFADAGFKARLADLGGAPLAGSPEEFGKFIADDVARWAKVVKFAGIKAS